MAIPTVKTIRQIEWLDKLRDIDPDQAATIARQAMEWAETGKAKPTLKRYAGARGFSLAPGSHYGRVKRALEIMDHALETHEVEYIHGKGEGIFYLNTGDPYNTTIIHDLKTGNWRVTSWGDIVERNERRFGESGGWANNPSSDELIEVFRAQTRGGKWKVIVTKDPSLTYGYEMQVFKNDRAQSTVTGFNQNQIRDRVLHEIANSKHYDGIDYKIKHDELGVEPTLVRHGFAKNPASVRIRKLAAAVANTIETKHLYDEDDPWERIQEDIYFEVENTLQDMGGAEACLVLDDPALLDQVVDSVSAMLP